MLTACIQTPNLSPLSSSSISSVSFPPRFLRPCGSGRRGQANCSQNFSMILRFVWAMDLEAPAADKPFGVRTIPCWVMNSSAFSPGAAGSISKAIIQMGQYPHLKDFPRRFHSFIISSQSGRRGAVLWHGFLLLRDDGRDCLPAPYAVGFGFLPRTANGAHSSNKKPLRAVRQRRPRHALPDFLLPFLKKIVHLFMAKNRPCTPSSGFLTSCFSGHRPAIRRLDGFPGCFFGTWRSSSMRPLPTLMNRASS